MSIMFYVWVSKVFITITRIIITSITISITVIITTIVTIYITIIITTSVTISFTIFTTIITTSITTSIIILSLCKSPPIYTGSLCGMSHLFWRFHVCVWGASVCMME